MIWRPMETAPKDGTRILAFAPQFPNNQEFVTAWRPADCREGWGSIDSCCGYYVDLKPTHWMPLPPPPTTHIEASAMKDPGDILLEEYIKWCRMPWWRRTWRRLFNTGPVFAGHTLPECFADKPSGSQP